MRSVLRILKIALLFLIVLVIVALAAFLGLRYRNQSANAISMAIHTPNGIDESSYVRIGGIDQWIQIRGQDRANPVLLCLHGGPGGIWTPLTALFLPWEKEFTVVLWDQRGAGKTLESTGAGVANSMTIDRMTQDGIEVAGYLRSHLHKNRVIVLGHSFGSILGARMAHDRPDLLYAFVGTGQIGNMKEDLALGYALLQEKSRASGDRNIIDAVQGIGPPPWDDMNRIAVYFRLLREFEPRSDRDALSSPVGTLTNPAPGISLRDEYNRVRGFASVPTLRIYQEMLSTDLAARGLDFKVPVFILQGTDDNVTFASVAREYFDNIQAPRKEFVPIEGGGHFAVWGMPERFRQELVNRVRALAVD
jgi:pimeloyl-ACP methyl ester carboxylesterase